MCASVDARAKMAETTVYSSFNSYVHSLNGAHRWGYLWYAMYYNKQEMTVLKIHSDSVN